MNRSILAAAAFVLVLASPAVADRRTAALTSHSVISNGSESRLLFKAPELRTLSSVAIRGAHIEFEVTGDTADRRLFLSLSPVTREWNAGSVTWTSGWTRPGGDFDEDLAAETSVDLSRTGRTAYFDVTPILKEWLEEGVTFDGFILSVQAREGGEGIRGEDVSRFQGLANASLVVDYRRVRPPPRARRGRG